MAPVAPARKILSFIAVPLNNVTAHGGYDTAKLAIAGRWSEGCPRIDQNTLANFIESGSYDQQLRRMRRIYRQRREVLIEALARRLPEAEVTGIAAGLHATIRLPAGIDEDRLCAAMARHGVAADMMHKYRIASKGPPTLLLGYGRASESALRTGVRILAQAVADGSRAAA